MARVRLGDLYEESIYATLGFPSWYYRPRSLKLRNEYESQCFPFHLLQKIWKTLWIDEDIRVTVLPSSRVATPSSVIQQFSILMYLFLFWGACKPSHEKFMSFEFLLSQELLRNISLSIISVFARATFALLYLYFIFSWFIWKIYGSFYLFGHGSRFFWKNYVSWILSPLTNL